MPLRSRPREGAETRGDPGGDELPLASTKSAPRRGRDRRKGHEPGRYEAPLRSRPREGAETRQTGRRASARGCLYEVGPEKGPRLVFGVVIGWGPLGLYEVGPEKGPRPPCRRARTRSPAPASTKSAPRRGRDGGGRRIAMRGPLPLRSRPREGAETKRGQRRLTWVPSPLRSRPREGAETAASPRPSLPACSRCGARAAGGNCTTVSTMRLSNSKLSADLHSWSANPPGVRPDRQRVRTHTMMAV